MMMLELGLFFFVLLGSKIVIGAIVVYLLLPTDAQCEICDAELLPVEHPRGTRRLLRLLRLQRRWCMECGRDALTRCQHASAGRAARSQFPVAESRVR
ncbi:hypothetical protein BH23GEM10_BH23GEM10_17120 [soil metagenome]